MLKIPAVRDSFWKRHEWAGDVFAGMGALASTAIAAVVKGGQDVHWSVFIAPVALALVGGAWKWGLAYKKSRASAPAKELADFACCCQMIHAAIKDDCCNADDPGSLRVAVYVVRNKTGANRFELEQVTPYAGPDSETQGQVGRKLNASVGVVGLTARTGKIQVAERESDDLEAMWNQMTKDFGFTMEEAKELDTRAQCWLGVPLCKADGKTVAVLYVASRRKACFTPDVVGDILRLAAGMSEIISARYSARRAA